jgi:hypothetical protein
MSFCAKCGHPVETAAAFCGSCGNAVAAPAPSPQFQAAVPQVTQPSSLPLQQPAVAPIYVQMPPQQAPRSGSGAKALLWVALGGAAVFFLIIVAVFFFAVGRSSSSPDSGSSISDGGSSLDAAPPQVEIDVTAIRSAMQQDADYRSAAETEIKGINVQTQDDIDRIASIMRGYVTNSSKIDTSSCPRDFAEAFSLHLSSWTEAADTVGAHPQIPEGDDAVVYGFIRGLNGDPTGGMAQLQDDLRAWVKSVQDRQQQVDRAQGDLTAVAVKYGVQ